MLHPCSLEILTLNWGGYKPLPPYSGWSLSIVIVGKAHLPRAGIVSSAQCAKAQENKRSSLRNAIIIITPGHCFCSTSRRCRRTPPHTTPACHRHSPLPQSSAAAVVVVVVAVAAAVSVAVIVVAAVVTPAVTIAVVICHLFLMSCHANRRRNIINVGQPAIVPFAKVNYRRARNAFTLEIAKTNVNTRISHRWVIQESSIEGKPWRRLL